jgi:tetratricopeptide (TPR) repeat protein
MVCAWHQTTFWRDSIGLWEHALAVTSNNQTAHQNLAAALWARDRKDEAREHLRSAGIIHWQTVLKDYPFDNVARDELGTLLIQSGNARNAIEQWETSLQIKPDDGNAQNNLAWVLATYPDSAIRDGKRAVQLAESAANLSGGDAPIVLRTLAAAYAEHGDFSKAIETNNRALRNADAQRNSSLADTLRHELSLYEVNKPYREMPQQ